MISFLRGGIGVGYGVRGLEEENANCGALEEDGFFADEDGAFEGEVRKSCC